MRELLIATTNNGKIAEIKAFLSTMPFKLITLADLPTKIEAPEENAGTVDGNALIKARYYAEKTGHLTLADDGGFFIKALNGWPGPEAANIADTSEGRLALVIEKMQGQTERTAYWESVLALVDPDSNVEFLAHGRTSGTVLEAPNPGTNGFGFDPIFLVTEAGKAYSEMNVIEKNAVSHRGKALIRIKHHLHNTYVAKHIVVPCALIIKDGQILMNKRNDPHRPEYHGKWEFPGGKIELHETIHENVIREVQEEVGYDVEVVKLLQHIAVESQVQKTYAYQVILVPYVCRVVGGELNPSDEEVMDTRWFDLDNVLNHDLIGENAKMYKEFVSELKEVVKENAL